MLNYISKYLFLFVFSVLCACSSAPSRESAETTRLSSSKLISQAIDTLQDFEARSKQQNRIIQHFRNAKAVIIIPKLHKAGFFVGGERGAGILLARQGGVWGYPIFYNINSASIGIQFGYEQSQHLLFVLSDKALDKLLANKIEIGGEVSVSAANYGGSAEVATAFAGIDIVSYSLAAGLFAGVSFEGSYLEFNGSFNDNYYGARGITAQDIMAGQYNDRQADQLRELLTQYSR